MELVVKSCHVNAKRKPHEFGFGSVIMRKIPAAIANRLFCRLWKTANALQYTFQKLVSSSSSSLKSFSGCPWAFRRLCNRGSQTGKNFFLCQPLWSSMCFAHCTVYLIDSAAAAVVLRWNGLELWAHELMLLLHTIIPTCVWVWRSTKPISPSLHATTLQPV